MQQGLQEAKGVIWCEIGVQASPISARCAIRLREQLIAMLFRDRWTRLFAWYEKSPGWVRYGVGPPLMLPVLALWMACVAPRTTIASALILIGAYCMFAWKGLIPPGFFDNASFVFTVSYLGALAGGYLGIVEDIAKRWLSPSRLDSHRRE